MYRATISQIFFQTKLRDHPPWAYLCLLMREIRSQYLHDICPFLAGFHPLSVKFCWWNAKYGGPAAPALPLVRRCDPPDNGWWPETLMTEELEKLILDPTSAGSKHQLLWIFHNHCARQEILQWGLGLDGLMMRYHHWEIQKSQNAKRHTYTMNPTFIAQIFRYCVDHICPPPMNISWIIYNVRSSHIPPGPEAATSIYFNGKNIFLLASFWFLIAFSLELEFRWDCCLGPAVVHHHISTSRP